MMSFLLIDTRLTFYPLTSAFTWLATSYHYIIYIPLRQAAARFFTALPQAQRAAEPPLGETQPFRVGSKRTQTAKGSDDRDMTVQITSILPLRMTLLPGSRKIMCTRAAHLPTRHFPASTIGTVKTDLGKGRICTLF